MAGAGSAVDLARTRTGCRARAQQRSALYRRRHHHGQRRHQRRAVESDHRRPVRHRFHAPVDGSLPRDGAAGQPAKLSGAGARRAERPACRYGSGGWRGHLRHAHHHFYRRQAGPAHGRWPRPCGRSGSGGAGHSAGYAAAGRRPTERLAPVRAPLAAAPAKQPQGQLRQRGRAGRRHRHVGRTDPGGAHGPACGRGARHHRFSRRAAGV